jgi:hypothetical protein
MYVNKVFDPIQSKMYVWDSFGLEWIAWDGSGGGGGGGDVNVTNWPLSQTVDDGGGSLTVDGSITVEKTEGMALRLDEASATVMYIGDAVPGSVETATVWRIKKMDTSSGTSITWAGGAGTFINRWDQRASLTYT